MHTIRRDLQPVFRDSVLKKASIKMLDKVDVFSRLRFAMRITLPENKCGLNDDGELCSMKAIEKEVTKFIRHLSKDKNRMKDKAYQKLIAQINKYSGLLFCDPIIVETKAGKILIQPQRTNNLLEQFFRTLMRTYRKKNGFQAVARILKAMLKDTPLVMNLRNKDFKMRLDELLHYFSAFNEKKHWNLQASYLSGGQQNSLALMMVLLNKPQFLILDEPSAGLSVSGIKELYNMLTLIKKENKITILLIEQNISKALSFSQKMILLQNGRLKK